ncbi:DUF4376 domain-containing protein [Agrobacterium salinitolerans]|uniref:DUF4376 domain-containing protein n=1 Tax=Agrobacterium salinitolerans TaxID=1183413 RepID=A0A9X9KDN9_9HYPH|nr:DUF4376 domain-containing protein [Agrobacterium salinitolerans]UYZ08550.1 DUF4376 domain-containing protein [Agrobacterium salinitolerans]
MVDFFVAMPVDTSTGQQTGQPFIAEWNLSAQRPTPEEIETFETAYADILATFRQPHPDAVDIERDRRIDAGFVFEGVHYQSRPEDRENIAGAKAAATDAITIFGAEAGNFAWQQLLDPGAPPEFRWIAADNSTHPMDAQTAMRFGYAALGHKQAHIFAARALKDMDPIPADYATNPAYWP